MAKKKIGLSVSFCIADILAGTIKEENVEKIMGGTCITDDAEWEELISRYKERYWHENPEEGEAIFRRFLKAGKIEQPRLAGAQYRDIADGCWL